MSEVLSSWAPLVARIGAGDRSAEAELVEVFGARVHCMLLARTRNVEAARELTQDVMMHALHALRNGQIRQAESLPGFIQGIARNLISGHRRAATQEAQPLPDEDDPNLACHDHAPDERMALVRDALERLSSSDRNILLMILVDGMSPAEIANRLNLSAEVVRQRKTRAIKRVREAIEKRRARWGRKS